MNNELCELAATGMGVSQIIVIILCLVSVAIGLILIYGARGRKVRWVLPALILGIGLIAYPHPISAQATPDSCPLPSGQVDNDPSEPIPGDGEPTEPSPITANHIISATDHFAGICYEWPLSTFSVDMMDGSFFSTIGTGTLLANTIDLDPETPGIQTSVTIHNSNSIPAHVTLTVDSSGTLTMTTPHSVDPSYSGVYTLEFTIQDSDGFTSTVGSYLFEAFCA